MDVRAADNRGLNFFGVASLALIIASDALFQLAFEADWEDKIDDIWVTIVAAAAIIWYRHGGNRYSSSVMPLVFLLLGLAGKIAALVIERDDAAAVGPDIGITLFLVLTSIVLAWQMYAHRGESTA